MYHCPSHSSECKHSHHLTFTLLPIKTFTDYEPIKLSILLLFLFPQINLYILLGIRSNALLKSIVFFLSWRNKRKNEMKEAGPSMNNNWKFWKPAKVENNDWSSSLFLLFLLSPLPPSCFIYWNKRSETPSPLSSLPRLSLLYYTINIDGNLALLFFCNTNPRIPRWKFHE